MKTLKILTAALISLTILMWSGSVSADIIMEPSYNNKFYEVYYDECELEPTVRKYTVTTECDVFMSPLSSQKVRTAHEGSTLHMNAFYTDKDGVRWGYDYAYSYGDKAEEMSGWVKMENVQVVYDHISFMEEHGGEVTDYNGQLDSYVPREYVYIWSYPGSEQLIRMCSAANWFPEDYFLTVQDTAVYTYVDAEGHEWVYLGYGYEGWVYLDAPEKDLRDSDPQTTPETSLSVTSEGVTLTGSTAGITSIEAAADPIPEPPTPIPETRTNDFILPLVLAAVAAAAAATVIAVTKKKQ